MKVTKFYSINLTRLRDRRDQFNLIELILILKNIIKQKLTLFMINVRSPCVSSSSGVGGNGRLGGPPEPCDGGCMTGSSETTPNGLYENSGLNKTK